MLKEQAHNTTVWHNTVQMLDNNAFYSARGTESEMFESAQEGCRIGKVIYITRLRVALHIEAQQYRPLTHYWLYLVRNKINKDANIDTKSEMFEGRSSTIPLDWIDTGRVDILFSKKFTVRMPNSGTSLGMLQDATGVGKNGFAYKTDAGEDYEVFTNPQIITKFNVPINMKIMYADESVVPATMRYQWVLCAYDNFTTFTGVPGSGGWPVGHISMTTVMQFKDV